MLELVDVNKSEYKDGSVWIKYNQGKTYCGFELRYLEDLLDSVSEDKIPLNQLACADIIQPLIEFQVPNLYIEDSNYEEYLNKITKDYEAYPELRDYISIDEERNCITVYGDIITKVLVPRD